MANILITVRDLFGAAGAKLAASMSGALSWARAHKLLAGIAVLIVAWAAWFGYGRLSQASAMPAYVLGTASTSTIVSALSESGQVTATDQINIQAKASGDVTWVGVKAGQKVAAGQALMSIDNTTALQNLADAKASLQQSELQYQKDSAQAPISYQTDQQNLETATQNLAEDYNTVYNDLTNTYLDSSSVISTAQNALFGYDFDPQRKLTYNRDTLGNLFASSRQDTSSVDALQQSASDDYAAARASYDAASKVYQQTARTAATSSIEALLAQSVDSQTDLTQALQTELNFYGAVSDLANTYHVTLPSAFSTVQGNIRSALSTANGHLSTLIADQKTLTTAKQAIANAQNTLTLDIVGNPDGKNPLSLQSEAISLQKQQQDIANQEADLADYTVRAPFAGTISAVSVKTGDNASGAVATIVSSSQVAELSLNEVDVAKIQLGDKVTLSFDAVDGLTLVGTIAEIDPVGTVSQGVVSYTVKVTFDTQDPRVKPGMTVTADIQTGVAQNALAVPSSAIHTQNGGAFVLVFDPPLAATGTDALEGIATDRTPISVPVTTGLSDDANTQILSGLSAGEQVVVRTTTSASTASSASARAANVRGAAAGAGAFRGGATFIGGGGGRPVIGG